jgi:hypothetical protein
MLELLAIWVIAALITATWNIYTQLVLADNWPPSSWRRISWDAAALLVAVCLAAWPLVLALALGDYMEQKQ